MTTEQQRFEAWRPVVGFEGLYEVSDHGRVRRVGRAARNGNGRGGGARIGRVLAPLTNTGGHLKVQLWSGGKMHPRLIHRLVAEAFIGPLAAGVVVNHVDGLKSNNHVENLERTSHSGNLSHAYRTGLREAVVPHGTSHHNAKLDADKAAEIRRRYKPGICTLKMLAREFGVDHKTVHSIVSGKTWKGAA